MMPVPRFRYDGMTSFRYDRGSFRDVLLFNCPTSSFRKWGGFTSYHNEKAKHFFIILKGELKTKIILEIIPKFYHSEDKIIFYDFW